VLPWEATEAAVATVASSHGIRMFLGTPLWESRKESSSIMLKPANYLNLENYAFNANYSNLENYAFDANYSNLENHAFDANYSNLENYSRGLPIN
jgi:hypothetical protein